MQRILTKIINLAYHIYPTYFYVLIFKVIVDTGIILFNSFYISYIITLVTTKNFTAIVPSLIFLIGCDVFLNAILKVLNKYNEYQVDYLARLIYKKVVMHLNEVKFQYIEDAKNQERIENIKFAVYSQGAINQTLTNFTSFLTALITIISLIGSLIFLEPLLILITLVGFILTILISLINYKTTMKFFHDIIPINRRYSYYLDVLNLPQYQKDLRIFSLGEHMQRQLVIFSHKTEEQFIKFSLKSGIINAVNTIFNYVELGLIYLLIAYNTISKKLGIPSFTLQVNLATNLYTNLNTAFTSFVQLMRFRNYLRPIVEVMNLPKAQSIGTLKLNHFSSLEFRNVTFAYPNTNSLVLDDVSFKINAGEKIALVGLNGAGKSTIVKLVCRLYEVDKGEILINGHNILYYDLNSYYELISTVFQDYKLFAISLRDNILIGKDKDISPILKELNLTEVIAKLPQKLDSYYSKEFNENGVELSGGEAQKIAIARCLARNSDFVILDEPTAALDPLAEANIYANFKELASDRTAIYISHRLASAIFCDKVLVLDNGKIVDYAPHKVLMQKPDSLYAKLFNLQKENYKTTKNV